jgi:hypothetical protein
MLIKREKKIAHSLPRTTNKGDFMAVRCFTPSQGPDALQIEGYRKQVDKYVDQGESFLRKINAYITAVTAERAAKQEPLTNALKEKLITKQSVALNVVTGLDITLSPKAQDLTTQLTQASALRDKLGLPHLEFQECKKRVEEMTEKLRSTRLLFKQIIAPSAQSGTLYSEDAYLQILLAQNAVNVANCDFPASPIIPQPSSMPQQSPAAPPKPSEWVLMDAEPGDPLAATSTPTAATTIPTAAKTSA